MIQINIGIYKMRHGKPPQSVIHLPSPDGPHVLPNCFVEEDLGRDWNTMHFKLDRPIISAKIVKKSVHNENDLLFASNPRLRVRLPP